MINIQKIDNKAQGLRPLKAALEYAGRGWHVLPLHTPDSQGACSCSAGAACGSSGKHPRGDLVPGGVNDATDKKKKIRQWWADLPDANIGIACGPSRLLVVDIDPRHGGDKTFKRLKRQHGPDAFPATATSITSAGGRHLYYLDDPKGSRNVTDLTGDGGGVDIKAERGLIVAPPSLHHTGEHYRWAKGKSPDECEVAQAPEWLLGQVVQASTAERSDDGGPILNGHRNETLFRLACGLRRRDLSSRAIAAALRVINVERCENPLPESEIEKIADSAGRYDPAESLASEITGSPKPKPIDWTEFADIDHSIGDWRAEPLLPRGTLVMLYSSPGIGKSLLSLELAAKLSLGLAFLAQSSGRPLSVVYLDSEMTESDLADRLASLNLDPSQLVNLHYYLLQDIPPLDTKQGGAAVHDICQEHNADLCIIDPMVNTLKGEENESNTIKDWTRYTILPLKADGVTVLVLDHSGKDRRLGMRGSSAKKAAADVVWRMVGTGKGVRLKADKRRQGWIPEYVDLVRTQAPYLSHVLVANIVDPVGTAEAIAELNELDVPPDATYGTAGKMLRAAGKRRSQAAVQAAQRKRRDPNLSSNIDFGDSVAEFCRDVVLQDEEYRCSTREVYDSYKSWAEDQSYEVMGLQDFANVVKTCIPGVRRKKNPKGINEWRGLKTPLLIRKG